MNHRRGFAEESLLRIPIHEEQRPEFVLDGFVPDGERYWNWVLVTRTGEAIPHYAGYSGSLISLTSGVAVPLANELYGISSNLATCVALTNRAIELERRLLRDVQRSDEGSRAIELTPEF